MYVSSLAAKWQLSVQSMTPFLSNFSHWLYRNLSIWQLSVQPMTKMSKWQHFRLNVDPEVVGLKIPPGMKHSRPQKLFLVNTNSSVNTLRPRRQNGRHFADDILMCIFLNENVWIPIEMSLKFVPKGPISNIPALVEIMAWRRPGDKPLSEPMMASSLTHIC